jgi:hypothetical protein
MGVSKSIGESEQEQGNRGPGFDWEKPKIGYPSVGTRFLVLGCYLIPGNQDNFIYIFIF